MPWGFCCGDGWFDIIWKLSTRIDRHVRKQSKACEQCGHGRLSHPGDGGTNERPSGPRRVWCKKCPVSIWKGCLDFKKPYILDPMAVQVKEKFGGLRFYMGGGIDSMIEQFIRQAEEQAEKTCEDCGKPGKPAGSWVRTLCYDCRVDRSGKEYADKVEADYANKEDDEEEPDTNGLGTEVG